MRPSAARTQSEEDGFFGGGRRSRSVLLEKRSLLIFLMPAGDGGEREHEFTRGGFGRHAFLKEREGFRLDVDLELAALGFH